MEDIEDDLREAKSGIHGWSSERISRVFLTGANPFVLSYDKLTAIAKLIHKYLPSVKSVGSFARITDVAPKTDEELARLRAFGYDGLTIGIETGDDEALRFMNKGYTSADILEQCRKLDEAGIEYYFVYMTGFAGKGGGYQNARNSARLYSQLNPYFVSVDSLTLFPETELYQMAQQGLFVPAEEKERIRELQILVKNLHIRTHLLANTVSNFTPVTAYLPYDREKIINELQFVLDHTDEMEMHEYRKNLKNLG